MPPTRASLSIAAVAAALFGIDLVLVVSRATSATDRSVEMAIQAVPWGPLGAVFGGIDWLGGPRQAALGVTATIGALLWRRRRAIYFAAGFGASLLKGGVDLFIHRPRPSGAGIRVLVHPGGPSFPSGHATFFTWTSVLLAALIGESRPRAAPFAYAAAALVIVTVDVSRVYEGAHWPSDVVGGTLLALAWSGIVLAVARKLRH